MAAGCGNLENVNFNQSKEKIQQQVEQIKQRQVKEEYERKLNKWLGVRERMIQDKIKYIPKKSGVYCLYFPEGFKYWGSSNDLRQRIKQHLWSLFPNPEFNYDKARAQWYEKCHNKFPQMTIDDIQIKYEVRHDYREYEREKLQQIKGDENLRSQFFNSNY